MPDGRQFKSRARRQHCSLQGNSSDNGQVNASDSASVDPPAAPALPTDGATPWDDVRPEIEVAVAVPTAVAAAAGEACESSTTPARSGGAFTIPLICLGVGVIAMCLLIPAADEVRRLAYERDRLKADLEQLQKQVTTNDAFLRRVAADPVLAERLARRQMKMVPEGTAVLDLKSVNAAAASTQQEMSPFLLVTVPPPAPMPPYRPIGGRLADACRHPKTQLYLIGGALMAIASGLVLSRSSSPATDDENVDGEGALETEA